jgi:sodium transport system permease protein
MNWKNVRLILAREIRDQLRDRRTLFMIAVLPLLLYPLLGMVFFQIAQFMQEHPSKVLVVGGWELESFTHIPRLFEGKRFRDELFDSPHEAELLELEFRAAEAPAREATPLAAEKRRIQSGEFDLLVYFPGAFGSRLESLDSPETTSREDFPSQGGLERNESPVLYRNTASEMSQIAHARVARVLDRWRQQILEHYLKRAGFSLAAAKALEFQDQDVAESRHRDAAVWSKVLPFILMIWALTGAFYPAVDVCAGEKERGTLETLLSSPAERSEIVWAKLLTVMIFSMITAVLNLLSLGLTGTFVVEQLNQVPSLSAGLPLSLPPLAAVVWLLVALVPISALFGALCLALAAFARSTKEGQYYLMPLVLITMPLMVLPMAPGVELTLGVSLIPVTGVILLLRTMLEGNTVQALPYAAPVIGVTLLCCLLAIRWAVDQFNQESVLFREGERFDLRLWMRHLVRDRQPTPSVSEAVSCFVIILLVQFFMNMALPPPRLDVFEELVDRIFVGLVVMIALPALLMTILFTSSERETLLLRRPVALAAVPAAVLLAAAVHPLAHSLQFVVQSLYPPSEAAAAHARSLIETLTENRSPWVYLALLAALPAVCEELAFRGFILSGLRHLGHKWWAIGLSAVFFGIAHGLLQQSIMASLLGVLLGYVAVQSGSIWPCMLFHVTHNTLILLSSKITIDVAAVTRHPELGWLVKPFEGADGGYVYAWPPIVAGAVAAAWLLRWMHQLPYTRSREEQLQEALGHQTLVTLVRHTE